MRRDAVMGFTEPLGPHNGSQQEAEFEVSLILVHPEVYTRGNAPPPRLRNLDSLR